MISDIWFKFNYDPSDPTIDVHLKFQNDEIIVDESTKKQKRKTQMKKRLEKL
jgi:hypothetical protein